MSQRSGEATPDLLICEDVMLLLANDRSGTLNGSWARWMIAGAALMDLCAMGRMRRSEPGETRRRDRLVHVSNDATGSEALDTILMRLGTRQMWRPEMAINQIQRRLVDALGEELAGRGIVRTESRTVFNLKRWPTVDGRAESSMRTTLAKVLVDGEEPDAHTAAVIAALWAGKVAHRTVLRDRKVATGRERRAIQKRAQQIGRQHWLARPTQRAIQGQQAAVHSA